MAGGTILPNAVGNNVAPPLVGHHESAGGPRQPGSSSGVIGRAVSNTTMTIPAHYIPTYPRNIHPSSSSSIPQRWLPIWPGSCPILPSLRSCALSFLHVSSNSLCPGLSVIAVAIGLFLSDFPVILPASPLRFPNPSLTRLPLAACPTKPSSRSCAGIWLSSL